MPESETHHQTGGLEPLSSAIASKIMVVEAGAHLPEKSNSAAVAEVKFFKNGPAEALEEHENGIRKIVRDALTNEINSRRKFSNYLFALVAAWITAVMTVLFMQGCCSKDSITCIIDGKTAEIQSVSFFLSDSVLIALISGTSVSVIGLLVTVVNYIFPKENDLLRWAQSTSASRTPNSPTTPAAES